MKTKREFPGFTVTKKAEKALREGHPWVYDAEITNTEPCENGALVDIFSQKGAYLGTGFYSAASKIRIRRLSDNANEQFGDAFFARRVRYAVAYRRTVMRGDFSSCRLIFGEADGLPGLTVDKYENILSVQVLSYGMEQRKQIIYRALCDALADCGVQVAGIMERNDAAIRRLEGLETYKGWYRADDLPEPPSPIVMISENGISYAVDVENGQKTGFFLDQKYNRRAVMHLAKDMTVLDCFTHTGSFGLNAAMGGAAHVTSVDVSQAAIDMAKENAARNGLADRIDYLCTDVFELLPRLIEAHSSYDLVILDPPAFTKSRKTVGAAQRGYKEINYRAMKLLKRGGYLATCSCSHFMETALFGKMLADAAADAGVRLRIIEERAQAPDHPVLMGVPETSYLKFFLLQIV